MFAKHFMRAYERALSNDYRFFYDDFALYGNPESPHVIYFIEGIGGVAGQLRFALPSIVRSFGTDIFIKALHLPEFSAQQYVFDKYTIENVDKKRRTIVSDLEALAENHKQVTIVASSNGFYDFLYAYPMLGANVLRKAKLVWCAVAPDHFGPTLWEHVFYAINGMTIRGHRWFAVPNANPLRFINPELKWKHVWRHKGAKRIFFKDDLEFRFRFLGLNWDYSSIGCYNEMLAHLTTDARLPLPIKSYVLVATNDGYWQRKPVASITALVDKYLSNKRIVYKRASHLWLLMPENVSEVLELTKSECCT